MSQTPIQSAPPVHSRPLPVTITPGMPVVEIEHGVPGIVAGITPAYCIYRITDAEALVVAPWQDVALGNLCPADALLPADVIESDRRNALAAVLRELLALRQFGLTEGQSAVLDELIADLTGV